VAALDARLSRDLDRHFLDKGASEVIHGHFYGFDGGFESGRVSKRWIEAAPESAYANAARGAYYLYRAKAARGGAFAQRTPRENFQRMSTLADTAVGHLKKALEIEPRLMEAHANLIELAKIDSRDDLMRETVETAEAMDPGCRAWAQDYLDSLLPKWGGSWEVYFAFAESRLKHVKKRPLISIVAAMPLIDAGLQLLNAERYEEALKVAEEAMRRSTHIAPMRDAAFAMESIDGADRWRQLMYLLAESRTPDGSPYAARIRGRLLFELAQDVEWAALAIERAVDMDPASAWGQRMLGMVRWRQNRLDEAFLAFDEAIADPGERKISLYAASSAAIETRQIERARPYVERLRREYPEFAWGWYFVGHLGTLEQDGYVEIGGETHEAFKKFVELADRKDPDQRRAAIETAQWLKLLEHDAARAERRAKRRAEQGGSEP
jgi:tetratricopeptide (TPR) repeat protein